MDPLCLGREKEVQEQCLEIKCHENRTRQYQEASQVAAELFFIVCCCHIHNNVK